MTAPFIFVGTHRVQPGKREEFMKYFTEFCTGVVEPNEPRLHSFFGYTAPDSDLVTVVQVHPDADSMATHMRLIMQHIDEAYADYLEPESTMQIYGAISAYLAIGKCLVSSRSFKRPLTYQRFQVRLEYDLFFQKLLGNYFQLIFLACKKCLGS